MTSRRAFLRIGATAPLAFGPESPIFVCLFLSGGNDGHNTLVPLRTAAQNYETYRKARRELALPERSLLPIVISNREIYGLHPRLRTLRDLFRRRELAIFASVGAPASLSMFQHREQRERWRRILPSGTIEMPLTQIPQAIAAGNSQNAFVSTIEGFDTHGAQLAIHDGKLAVLDRAIAQFYEEMARLQIRRRVTLFTVSEFGRTLASNSTEGTNHGWANHHFVFGDPIRGGEMYGKFPNLADPRSGMIPAISIDHYRAAVFGKPLA